MTPFDRSYTTFYWSAIVSIGVLYVVPFSSYLTLNNRYLDKVTVGHSNWYHSKGAVSYSPSIVTMALSCIISDINRDTGRKSWSFHTACIWCPH